MGYKYHDSSRAFFINPYSFVPAGFGNEAYEGKRKNIEEQSGNIEEKHSGVLRCKLFPITPLAVPDTASPSVFNSRGTIIGTGDSNREIHLNPNEKYHYGYHFMRNTEGNPMIPGSSLRGVIRSVYEAATDSCFSTADGKQSITYRTRKQFSPGLLYKNANGGYELYAAERYIFIVNGSDCRQIRQKGAVSIGQTSVNRLRSGQPVWFSPLRDKYGREVGYSARGHLVGKYIKDMKPGETTGYDKGYFCVGEPFSRKHFESVFKKKGRVSLAGYGSQLEKAVSDLDTIIEMYNDRTVNIKARGGSSFYKDRHYGSMKKGKYLPVWYQNDPVRKTIYLSVAAIGRSAYQKTMGMMLGSHTSCDNRKSACPACRLFGLVGQAPSDAALGSRVRFTDALMDKPVTKCSYKDLTHLRELAGPKTSYMPFYLRNNTPNDPASWSYDSSSVTLSGRKFYWHNTAADAYTEKKREKAFGERNSSMELIGPGKEGENVFSFQVYFDNLTDEELRQLIWALTLGENERESRHCHKIGHGKPIGLGSAKIVIENAMERDFSDKGYNMHPLLLEQYCIELGQETQGIDFEKDAVDALRIITDLDSCKLPVTYPAVVDINGNIIHNGSNSQASHQWFSFNYRLGDRRPRQTLPQIGSQNDIFADGYNKTPAALQYIEQL